MSNQKYSTNFEIAVSMVLGLEGGFNDIAVDKGGATNYGISLAFLKRHKLDLSQDGVINEEDIRQLTQDKAIKIYYEYFWDDDFESINKTHVCNKVFEMTVNMGKRQAVKLLQRALRACGQKDIIDDGIIGSKTLGVIRVANLYGLKASLKSEQAGFYRLLAVKDSSQKIFLKGWLNRAYEGG
ncbi:MAG: hypothetical protein GY793_04695 [Proteobacteria bacterium]|nr:hypothetical protein [Pseudomonadota bacterium]